MDRKILKAVNEQEMSIDNEDYSIGEISSAFSVFARAFDSFESAIDNLPRFVEEFYKGNDIESFKNTVRTGYKIMVDELLESVRGELEKRVVKSI